MTEATQTTFFRDFFGKEMSESSGLANQLTTGGARQNDGGSLTSGLVVEWGNSVAMLPAAGILVGA